MPHIMQGDVFLKDDFQCILCLFSQTMSPHNSKISCVTQLLHGPGVKMLDSPWGCRPQKKCFPGKAKAWEHKDVPDA